jgi:hypothetical protein
MSLAQAAGRPSRVYYGNVLFYLAKLGLGVSGVFLMLVAIGVSVAGIVITLQAGNYTIETLGMVMILLYTFGTGLFLGVTFLHMYPEVGISETHFWYRHFGLWQVIPWDEIKLVRPAKTFFITQGLVVYSDKLPFYYSFFGRAYGRQAGRALFIPNQLSRIDELKEQLRRYCRARIEA